MTPDADMDSQLATAARVASVPKLRQNMAGFWKRHSGEPVTVTRAAIGLWQRSPGERGEMARMGVAILLGPAAIRVPDALAFMLGDCADDASWRVQEALAKGMDWQCAMRGWKESVPFLETWLAHPKAHIRRAAAEGPRVWTRRDFFSQEPAEALRLLGLVRADPSDYVRKSAGNALRDISKTAPELVLETLERWAAARDADPAVIRRACRKLRDTHADRTSALLAEV